MVGGRGNVQKVGERRKEVGVGGGESLEGKGGKYRR